MESFNSDVIMVVNGQRITAFVNDCLCGINAITQYYLNFAHRQPLLLILFFFSLFNEIWISSVGRKISFEPFVHVK